MNKAPQTYRDESQAAAKIRAIRRQVQNQQRTSGGVAGVLGYARSGEDSNDHVQVLGVVHQGPGTAADGGPTFSPTVRGGYGSSTGFGIAPQSNYPAMVALFSENGAPPVSTAEQPTIPFELFEAVQERLALTKSAHEKSEGELAAKIAEGNKMKATLAVATDEITALKAKVKAQQEQLDESRKQNTTLVELVSATDLKMAKLQDYNADLQAKFEEKVKELSMKNYKTSDALVAMAQKDSVIAALKRENADMARKLQRLEDINDFGDGDEHQDASGGVAYSALLGGEPSTQYSMGSSEDHSSAADPTQNLAKDALALHRGGTGPTGVSQAFSALQEGNESTTSNANASTMKNPKANRLKAILKEMASGSKHAAHKAKAEELEAANALLKGDIEELSRAYDAVRKRSEMSARAHAEHSMELEDCLMLIYNANTTGRPSGVGSSYFFRSGMAAAAGVTFDGMYRASSVFADKNRSRGNSVAGDAADSFAAQQPAPPPPARTRFELFTESLKTLSEDIVGAGAHAEFASSSLPVVSTTLQGVTDLTGAFNDVCGILCAVESDATSSLSIKEFREALANGMDPTGQGLGAIQRRVREALTTIRNGLRAANVEDMEARLEAARHANRVEEEAHSPPPNHDTTTNAAAAKSSRSGRLTIVDPLEEAGGAATPSGRAFGRTASLTGATTAGGGGRQASVSASPSYHHRQSVCITDVDNTLFGGAGSGGRTTNAKASNASSLLPCFDAASHIGQHLLSVPTAVTAAPSTSATYSAANSVLQSPATAALTSASSSLVAVSAATPTTNSIATTHASVHVLQLLVRRLLLYSAGLQTALEVSLKLLSRQTRARAKAVGGGEGTTASRRASSLNNTSNSGGVVVVDEDGGNTILADVMPSQPRRRASSVGASSSGETGQPAIPPPPTEALRTTALLHPLLKEAIDVARGKHRHHSQFDAIVATSADSKSVSGAATGEEHPLTPTAPFASSSSQPTSPHDAVASNVPQSTFDADIVAALEKYYRLWMVMRVELLGTTAESEEAPPLSKTAEKDNKSKNQQERQRQKLVDIAIPDYLLFSEEQQRALGQRFAQSSDDNDGAGQSGDNAASSSTPFFTLTSKMRAMLREAAASMGLVLADPNALAAEQSLLVQTVREQVQAEAALAFSSRNNTNKRRSTTTVTAPPHRPSTTTAVATTPSNAGSSRKGSIHTNANVNHLLYASQKSAASPVTPLSASSFRGAMLSGSSIMNQQQQTATTTDDEAAGGAEGSGGALKAALLQAQQGFLAAAAGNKATSTSASFKGVSSPSKVTVGLGLIGTNRAGGGGSQQEPLATANPVTMKPFVNSSYSNTLMMGALGTLAKGQQHSPTAGGNATHAISPQLAHDASKTFSHLGSGGEPHTTAGGGAKDDPTPIANKLLATTDTKEKEAGTLKNAADEGYSSPSSMPSPSPRRERHHQSPTHPRRQLSPPNGSSWRGGGTASGTKATKNFDGTFASLGGGADDIAAIHSVKVKENDQRDATSFRQRSLQKFLERGLRVRGKGSGHASSTSGAEENSHSSTDDSQHDDGSGGEEGGAQRSRTRSPNSSPPTAGGNNDKSPQSFRLGKGVIVFGDASAAYYDRPSYRKGKTSKRRKRTHSQSSFSPSLSPSNSRQAHQHRARSSSVPSTSNDYSSNNFYSSGAEGASLGLVAGVGVGSGSDYDPRDYRRRLSQQLLAAADSNNATVGDYVPPRPNPFQRDGVGVVSSASTQFLTISGVGALNLPKSASPNNGIGADLGGEQRAFASTAPTVRTTAGGGAHTAMDLQNQNSLINQKQPLLSTAQTLIDVNSPSSLIAQSPYLVSTLPELRMAYVLGDGANYQHAHTVEKRDLEAAEDEVKARRKASVMKVVGSGTNGGETEEKDLSAALPLLPSLGGAVPKKQPNNPSHQHRSTSPTASPISASSRLPDIHQQKPQQQQQLRMSLIPESPISSTSPPQPRASIATTVAEHAEALQKQLLDKLSAAGTSPIAGGGVSAGDGGEGIDDAKLSELLSKAKTTASGVPPPAPPSLRVEYTPSPSLVSADSHLKDEAVEKQRHQRQTPPQKHLAVAGETERDEMGEGEEKDDPRRPSYNTILHHPNPPPKRPSLNTSRQVSELAVESIRAKPLTPTAPLGLPTQSLLVGSIGAGNGNNTPASVSAAAALTTTGRRFGSAPKNNKENTTMTALLVSGGGGGGNRRIGSARKSFDALASASITGGADPSSASPTTAAIAIVGSKTNDGTANGAASSANNSFPSSVPPNAPRHVQKLMERQQQQQSTAASGARQQPSPRRRTPTGGDSPRRRGDGESEQQSIGNAAFEIQGVGTKPASATRRQSRLAPTSQYPSSHAPVLAPSSSSSSAPVPNSNVRGSEAIAQLIAKKEQQEKRSRYEETLKKKEKGGEQSANDGEKNGAGASDKETQ